MKWGRAIYEGGRYKPKHNLFIGYHTEFWTVISIRNYLDILQRRQDPSSGIHSTAGAMATYEKCPRQKFSGNRGVPAAKE